MTADAAVRTVKSTGRTESKSGELTRVTERNVNHLVFGGHRRAPGGSPPGAPNCRCWGKYLFG